MPRKVAQCRRFWAYENLEARQLLTVTVLVDEDDLSLTGTADGAVQVTATDTAGSFDILDDGVLVQSVTGVTGDVKVKLDDIEDSPDDSLAINLGGSTVDRVIVDLGDGTNVFTLSGGTVARSVKYTGGSGDDTVTLAADAAITQSIYASLGDGDDSLIVEGSVGRGVIAKGGDGDDTLQVAEGSTVGRGLGLNLGDGDNQVTIAGQLDGSLRVFGGDGDDTVSLLATAQVGRSVDVKLGDGDNTLAVSATIEGGLSYDGRDGDDMVDISSDAVIAGSVRTRLGDGENTFTHGGDIEQNLYVTSKNADDTAAVADTAIVAGETTIELGEQRDFPFHRGHGPRPFADFGGGDSVANRVGGGFKITSRGSRR
jgi:hypothetical protein